MCQLSNRLDRVSPCRADHSEAEGCRTPRTNYLGHAVLARSIVKYWFPVIAWMCLIFMASGDLMSAEHTSRFIGPFLLWLNPHISVETIEQFQFCVRKAAHLTEYAILALLLCRAVFRETNLLGTRSTLWGVWVACVFVAVGDEFRQSFVESRSASPWDVMIDSAGAIFGLLIYSRFIGGKSGRAK
jgi:VanZ family protein